ncbi:MAG: hypothetical protein QOJ29_705, partial [Thermoleophilaceae bacterium]|nr:hypothetical protein [Thermoleophilaceae bacterium]
MSDQANVLIDNRTELPNELVQAGVEMAWGTDVLFAEHASLAGAGYANANFNVWDGGSLMNRRKFEVPKSIPEEIRLARDLAERDDDVAAAMGSMIATAYADGMENFHADEQTTTLFNDAAGEMNLDGLLKEMYREYLIASQVVTVHAFARTQLEYTPEGSDGRARRTFDVSLPSVGILPAENIRLLGNDLFRSAPMAYHPGDDVTLKRWLEEF